MKIPTYGFPQCKEMVSSNELIRSTHTFYTRIFNGLKNVEKTFIPEETKITDGLEVLINIEQYYAYKFDLMNKELFFGEFPEHATSDNLKLELIEFRGVFSKYDCECIIKEYTCIRNEYSYWKKELDIYDVWRILDLEEEKGL